jgi:coenzyme F420-reducing hydrogenase beta subunit
MIEIKDKIKCSGCSACYNSCPVNAITMIADDEGFLYPFVDESICIKCSKCDCVCPYISVPVRNTDLGKCFAGYNKNSADRASSSSGGIFVALAKAVLNNGGVVYGAAYDSRFMVCHKKAEKEEELYPLMGSKYLQSRIGNIYKDVLAQLQKGRNVLFAGSSCQIGGLRGFLGKEYENLVCVDFICLGVPSPRVWSDYLDTYFERDKIQFVNFKDKTRGWHTFSLRIDEKEKSFNKNGRETYFFSGYFKHLYSRPACSECIYKKGNRISDITISDCWGYDKIAPELDDNKGLSSIECHTEQGLRLWKSIQDNLVWKYADINDVMKYNSNYCTSAPIGKKRDDFWADYDCMPKKKLFKKYCKPEKKPFLKVLLVKVKRKIRKIVRI